jgi:flagellar L-ring protein precursor FlgH
LENVAMFLACLDGNIAPWRHSAELAAGLCESHLRRAVLASALIFVGAAGRQLFAQDASLLLVPPAPQQPGQLMLENTSFMYRKLPPEAELRELKVNDIITVLVDYRSSMMSEGDAESRRRASLNAVLADWLKFDGKDLIPAPQNNGDLAVTGALNSQYRTESEMELRDSLTFKIAAAVVDIRPNGNLVIEARREIRINEEVWVQSLTGIVRRQSIGPDRMVRSDEVAELRIEKRERGFINDAYSRGWFTRWYDKWKPF